MFCKKMIFEKQVIKLWKVNLIYKKRMILVEKFDIYAKTWN
jgi:hypothetical protein